MNFIGKSLRNNKKLWIQLFAKKQLRIVGIKNLNKERVNRYIENNSEFVEKKWLEYYRK